MTTIIDFEHEWAQRNQTWVRWGDKLPPEDVLLRTRHPKHAGHASPSKSVRKGSELYMVSQDGDEETIHLLFGPYDIIEWTLG